ncbi:hypothetical protein VH569_34245 [Azospirillum sp. 11R-A]|uniref:hypothetical protein n=1 Tax=Azospirillum sp. 11R-A TaxID=3111634 RepID=UPI003C2212F2
MPTTAMLSVQQPAVIAKFRANAARVLAEPAVDRLQSSVLAIESASDTTCLFQLMAVV